MSPFKNRRVFAAACHVFAVFLLLSAAQVAHSDHNIPGEPGWRLDRLYSHWMKDHWDDIKNKPLNRLVIPGSHDAGTYDLGDSVLNDIDHKALDPDSPMNYCRINGWEFHVCTQLAQAQTETIYEQLHAGSRFFDLRFVRTKESSYDVYGPINLLTGLPDIQVVEADGYRYRIHHSFIGPSKNEIFNDIRRFLAQSGNENEIITLSLTKMVGYDQGKVDQNTFTTAEHREFLSEFGVEFINSAGQRRTLADYMVPPSIEVPTDTPNETVTVEQYNMTPQQIVGGYQRGNQIIFPTGKQLIVGYPSNDGGREQHDVYGAQSNLLWSSVDGNGQWAGEVHARDCKNRGGDWKRNVVFGYLELDEDCSNLQYPEPSQWQSEDAIANEWMLRAKGRDSTNDKAIVSNIAFGADKHIEFILNTIALDPDIIGWGSLESASAFTNPRAVPHLVARQRSDTNYIMADNYQDSALTAKAIALNKNPARVTLNIRTVRENNDACDRSLEPTNDVCDFFPLFTINGNVSEAPESTILGTQHQRGRVIDNNDNPTRTTGVFREPFWNYTIDVPWDSTLDFRISMYDDDPSPIDDHLIVTTTSGFGDSTLRQVAPGGQYCNRNKEWLGDGGSIFYELFIESWDAPNGGCGPAWVAPNIQVATAPGGSKSAKITYGAYTNEPPEYIALMKSRCWPVSTTSPLGLSNYTETFRSNWVPRPAPSQLPPPDIEEHGTAEFGVGSTTIQCEATFTDGTRSAKTFTVTVLDQEPPEITVPGDIDNFEATGLLTPVEIGVATATDNVDGEVAVTNDAPDTFPVGTTIVTWTATDAAGNEGTATQSVTVVDTTPPVLTIPPDTTAMAGREGEAIGEATATDAVGVYFISNDAPNIFHRGRTTVTWYAMDAAGNISSAKQFVSVKQKGGGAMGLIETLLLLLGLAVVRRRRAAYL